MYTQLPEQHYHRYVMPVYSKVSLNIAPLTNLRSNFSKKIFAKVGVLGNTDGRKDNDPLGNAGIGLVQEFGSVTNKIPPRSFLRMPLETKQNRFQTALEKSSLRQKILTGDVKGLMQSLGFVAEEIIDDAFKSQGFGMWQPNAPSTIRKKGSSKPLIDTSQLRRSITSTVIENKRGN